MKKKLFGTALALVVATTAIYAREQIRTYTVPKETSHAQAAPIEHTHAHLSIVVASIPRNGQTWFFKLKGDQQTIESAKPAFREFLKSVEFTDGAETPVKFKTPPGWEERQAGNMVIASLLVPGDNGKTADVSITSFPGDVGGELANYNRWRQQVGLSPVSEAPRAESISVGGVEGKFYQIGAEAAAPADPHAGLASAPADSSDPHAGLNIPPANGGNPHTDVGSPSPQSDSEGPKFDVPSTWKEKAPGPMVLKSYTVPGNGGDATVAISSFPGDVGGRLGNINRWRRQMGQPEIDDSQVNTASQDFAADGGKGYLVDIDGTDARTGKAGRLIAVAIPHGGNTWFYKLSGDKSTVEESKDTFLKFVKSVRY